MQDAKRNVKDSIAACHSDYKRTDQVGVTLSAIEVKYPGPSLKIALDRRDAMVEVDEGGHEWYVERVRTVGVSDGTIRERKA